MGQLKGAIVGDIQSLDGEQVRYAYYLRPDPSKALPQWLINFARAAAEDPTIRIYVVVHEVTTAIEKTCGACGAGLLRLTVDNTVEQILEFGAVDPARRQAEFEAKVKDARRRLETKLSLNLKTVDVNYGRVTELTRGMPAKTRDEYIEGVEEAERRWRDWADELSSRLDGVQASQDENELLSIESLIKEGAMSED
jgi:hypothetical protein